MDIKIILASGIPVDGLKETMTEAQFADAIKNAFADKDKRIKELEDAAAEAEAKAVQEKAEALVDTAIAEDKLEKGEREQYVNDAIANYDMTKRFIDKLVPFKSPAGAIAAAAAKAAAEKLKDGEQPIVKGVTARLAKIQEKNRK